MPFKITKVSAIVGIDPTNGDEGIWGFMGPQGWMPMVVADEVRMRLIIPVAEEMSKASGIPYRVVQFSTMTDVTEETKKKYL